MNDRNSRVNSADEEKILWNTRAVVILVVCIAIPLIVGAISALLTQNAMASFDSLNQPPSSPPAWLFPVAWTILYILMGISGFYIYMSNNKAHNIGIFLYVVQLLFNFFWCLIFFGISAYIFAAIWLAILLILIIALIVNTSKYSKAAMFMLIPYAAWCCFAMYLNIGIAILN